MYYSHSTSQPDNGINHAMSSSSTYYSNSATVLPMVPSTTADMTTSQSQQLTSHPILSHPPLSTSAQVYDHHQQQQHQELASHDASFSTVLPSSIDEDVSSHASSSLGGNQSGGQDGYILQLQKQLEESKHLQTQYYYRIEQLMSLVEKQTLRISELQEQLANVHINSTGNNLIQQQQHQQTQQQNLPYDHHPIQQSQNQQQQLHHHHQQHLQQQQHHH